jgi:O-antigen/teichoic acid export membrane protein
VVLNGVLIPLYGGVGAAMATVGSEIILLVAASLACRSYGLLRFRAAAIHDQGIHRNMS